ncbi:thiol reductant ABC exporter subunit CydD [Halorhodospira neutriphila]|uniref:Thiol reductant ABC exporter subunit CydD n=1 Tax=Halorhodospira neutriphila TaxID=168379 RepID=A0ABS1E4C2_9GAMM|nr:thiol reductant ABC exporter subunit CydD [Halorhodospira neutriphila]MBK1726062.1 thiol reductant ABC exporter subunit CydD [Halorhodospira neutriphila]
MAQGVQEGEPPPSRWLTAQARQARTAVAGAVGAGLADAGLVVAQAALIAGLLEAVVVAGRPPGELAAGFAALAGVFLARAGCTWARAAAGAEAARRITAAVRRRLYRHVAALGPARAAAFHSGDVASALVEQVEALEGFYAHYLPQTVLATAVPLALIAVVAALDPIAGGLLLLAAPLVPLFMALVGMSAGRLAQRQQRSFARISAHFLDRLRGLTTLRLFRATERAAASVEQAADEYRSRSMAVLRIAFLSSAVLELISALAVALVAIYIGFSLLGYLDFGPGPELGLRNGLLILLLAPEVFLPLRRLGQHYHDRASAVGAAEEITRVLRTPLPEAEAPPPRAAPPARDPQTDLPLPSPVPVAYRGVRVAFDGGEAAALQGVDLEVEAGERVVICGPSGAGKSTLLHLAAGFLAPSAGRVEVGGAPPPGAGGVAWLGQQPWLFHGSVRENLALADPQAGDGRLWQALGAADLQEAVAALPQGLETPLGEGGYGLSGGQASRLALARAVLFGAPVLLLDEPTAGLDPASARRVLDAVRRLAAGRRTVLMVAHDPQLHAWGDRRVVLEAGRVAEDRRA